MSHIIVGAKDVYKRFEVAQKLIAEGLEVTQVDGAWLGEREVGLLVKVKHDGDSGAAALGKRVAEMLEQATVVTVYGGILSGKATIHQADLMGNKRGIASGIQRGDFLAVSVNEVFEFTPQARDLIIKRDFTHINGVYYVIK